MDTTSTIVPTTVHVPDESLAALRARLHDTRWPAEDPQVGWDYGVPLPYARELVTAWADDFDWRAQEARINAVPQITTPIDGHDVHAFHVRSAHADATPLLLLHGWPGTPVEFLPMIDALVDPTAHGGSANEAFHVVAPTIPGFGLSGPAVGWNTDRAAAAFAVLMARLGYTRYVVHGYDTGSLIGRRLGIDDAGHVAGLHLTDVFGGSAPTPESVDESDPEQVRALENAMRYEYELGGYALVQSTRPQSLGYALVDSPVGLLAWMVERFRDWSGCEESPEEVLDRDEMLTAVSIYWHFATMGSAIRYYKEGMTEWASEPEPSTTPLALCRMHADLCTSTRATIEAHNRVVRWTQLPTGGHFGAWEQPDLLVADLRAALPAFAAAGA